MTTHVQSDDFDIAKTIFDQLKDLPAERQQRVLRWIAEGLGVSSVAPSLGTNVGGRWATVASSNPTSSRHDGWSDRYQELHSSQVAKE